MVEATPILQQAPTPAQAQAMSAAVMALARQRAIKAVKQEIRDRGNKPQYMARGEIVAAANDYLGNHRELIAEAKETAADGDVWTKRRHSNSGATCKT